MVAIAIEERASKLPLKLEDSERARFLREALTRDPATIEDRLHSLGKLREDVLAGRELAEAAWRRLDDSEVLFLQRELDKAEADLHAIARTHLDAGAEDKVQEFRKMAFEGVARRVEEVQTAKLEAVACITEAESRMLRLAYELEREREELSRLVGGFVSAQRFAQRIRGALNELNGFLDAISDFAAGSGLSADQVAMKVRIRLEAIRAESTEFLFHPVDGEDAA